MRVWEDERGAGIEVQWKRERERLKSEKEVGERPSYLELEMKSNSFFFFCAENRVVEREMAAEINIVKEPGIIPALCPG